MHHYQNRTTKKVTKLKIDGEIAYMNDVRYHNFLDEVAADPCVFSLRY
jgi:hypothetical protein